MSGFEPPDEDLDLGAPVVVDPDGTTQSLSEWVRGSDPETEDLSLPLKRRDPVEAAAYLLVNFVNGGTPSPPESAAFDLAMGIMTVEAIIDAVAARTGIRVLSNREKDQK